MLYPVLTQSRLLSDLSGVWNFKLDNGKGFEEKWYEKPLKDADTMPVPASYNDLKEGTDFRDHYGWVFYQRNISVPEYVKSQRIVLRCAAVTHYAPHHSTHHVSLTTNWQSCIINNIINRNGKEIISIL